MQLSMVSELIDTHLELFTGYSSVVGILIQFFFSIVDQIISITRSCDTYGIVGVSVHLSDIAEDLTYFYRKYPNGEQMNAFLCDRIGSTIWHSTFPRNPRTNTHDQHHTINIKYFEQMSDDMIRKILLDKDGSKRISRLTTGNTKQTVN